MRVLWLCNTMLPMIARQLGLEGSNKEGWVSGMADTVLADQSGNGIALSVAFPMQSVRQRGNGSRTGMKILQKEGRASEGSGITDKKLEAGKAGAGELGQDGAGAGELGQGGTGAEEFGKGGAAAGKPAYGGLCIGKVTSGESSLDFYGFPEDVKNPDRYDKELERIMTDIVDMVQPDIVHCFGTEYPHTLAMCRIFPNKTRLLVGLQGLCTLYAEAYYADLPEEAVGSLTFRDWLKRDSIRQQKEKFICRGRMEREAVSLTGNVTGRTEWDRTGAQTWHSDVRYHFMNESLRKEFYGPVWEEEKCIPRSIFLSQGDYPLKGLHYMLLALPDILASYPDTRVYVAGNSLVEYGTLKQKLKISAYGKYLRRLIAQNHLEGKVVFLGKLDAAAMRDRYLKSSLFVCCSALENSPNSLGEAMLLGMPCVSGDVGGIASIFTDGEDGILYEGFRTEESRDKGCGAGQCCEADRADTVCGAGGARAEGRDGLKGGGKPEDVQTEENGSRLETVAGNLAAAVLEMWGDPRKMREYCRNARAHALRTHDREKNYRRLVEIYEEIL